LPDLLRLGFLFFHTGIMITPVASQVALVVKNPSANAGDVRDLGLIPGSGRSPGGQASAQDSTGPPTKTYGSLRSPASQAQAACCISLSPHCASVPGLGWWKEDLSPLGIFSVLSVEKIGLSNTSLLWALVLCCMDEATGFHLLIQQIFVSARCAPSIELPSGVERKNNRLCLLSMDLYLIWEKDK